MKLKISILFVILSFACQGQNFKFSLRAGYGDYQLKEVKEMQQELLVYSQLVNAKSVHEFSDQIYYGLTANYLIGKKDNLGIDFAYYATGGRNHLRDYSGEYKLDMLLHAYRLGLDYHHQIFIKGKFDCNLGIEGGIIFSNMKIKEKYYLKDVGDNYDTFNLKAQSYFMEPFFLSSYHYNEKISLDFKCGYEVCNNGDLESDSYGDIHTDVLWLGLRVSLGLSYYL